MVRVNLMEVSVIPSQLYYNYYFIIDGIGKNIT